MHKLLPVLSAIVVTAAFGGMFRSGPNWKPKVYSEPIGECRKKFGKKVAVAK